MQSIDFYQSHLERVSRSFALCIPFIDGQLRLSVSLCYLLCRLLDTVEDALWEKEENQEKSFTDFDHFICSLPKEEEVKKWAESFPSTIPSSEKQLLADAFLIFSDLHAQDPITYKKIKKSVLNMSSGMRFFAHKPALKSLKEVNGYCFFVAGLVGELLTDLLDLNQEALYLDSYHFGLFLQKINLLKDQKDDAKEGRFWIHSREEVYSSLRENAAGAIAYLLKLPSYLRGYRLFCAFSLFLGLTALPWIERSWVLNAVEKISRMQTLQLMKKLEAIIDDNTALEDLFRELMPQIKEQKKELTDRSSCAWFHELYKEGRVTSSDLASLGIG